MERELLPSVKKYFKKLYMTMPLHEFIVFLRREGFSEEEIRELLDEFSPSKPGPITKTTTNPQPDPIPDPCD